MAAETEVSPGYEVLSAAVEPETATAIRERAKANDRTVSQELRRIIRQALEADELRPAA